MKIIKIEKLKNGKYKIYFDSSDLIVYDNVIIQNNLLYKTNIDEEIYKKILIDNKYFEVYDNLVKYISKKRRSEKEVKDYIIKKYPEFNRGNEVINKLKSIGLINDWEYCKAFINDKLYLSKLGINKIKLELINQNIPMEIINLELKKVDKDLINARLEKLIIKRIKSNRNNSIYTLKQKIMHEMTGLGYEKESIEYFIDKNIISEEDDPILRKEFDKVYNKLCGKYTGSELSNKVRQKLSMRGFSISKINMLLEKKEEY